MSQKNDARNYLAAFHTYTNASFAARREIEISPLPWPRCAYNLSIHPKEEMEDPGRLCNFPRTTLRRPFPVIAVCLVLGSLHLSFIVVRARRVGT